MVFNNIKSLKIKGIIVSFLTILILLNGWPLISGKVVNTILYNSTNVSISSAIKPQYEIFADLVKKQNQNFKILSFPLTNENYQVLKGKEGGAYFGPSSLTVLTGKNSFNGLKGFSVFGSQFQKMIEDKNYQSLNRLFGLLNIGYLFYDSDDYIYNSFPIHSYFPYSEWLKTIFPDQRAIGDFVNKLGFEKLFAVDSYNFYKANDLLPHIFVPKKIVVSNSGQNVLSKIIDFDNYNNRTAIYLTDTEAIKTGESELISSADSIFIEAKNNDKESIDIQNNYYYGEIFYPYIKEKSFLLWKLTLLNEYYQKWLSKANTGELIGKKIFYANKRINELITFKNKEKDQLKIYSDEIRGIIKILENTKDINLRNQSAFRLIINLEDNLSRLSYAGVSNYNLWEEIINQTIIEAKKYVSKVKIDEREYSLDIPKSGKYNVFLKGLPDTAQAYKTTPDYILEINDRRYDKFSENFSAEENGWVNWGQYDFGEGKTNIKLANNVSKDYLSQSKWYPFQQAPIYYKEALDWRAGIWYQLKGELKSGKRVNLAIVEKQGNIDDGRWRLKEIPQYKVLKQFIFSEYQKEFDCLVKFSYGATSAGVMIIDDKNQFLLEEVGQAFKDFKLVEVFEPEIILENVESVEPTKKSFPKITFTKINPTKYHVKVEEAKDKAYGIVFSENFDPGWRLYNVKNKTESKETTASYFEGEVQEGKHTNIFLDSNTFETWGKNPISEDKHFLVNGYANLWLVSPEDVGSQKEYELVLEFYPQRYFYFGLLISGIIFLACLRYVIYSLNKKLN